MTSVAASFAGQLAPLSGLSRHLARSIIQYGLTPPLKECPRYGARLQALEAAAEHALEE